MNLKRLFYFLVLLLTLPFWGFGQTAPVSPTQLLDIGGPGANIISTSMKLDAQENMYVMGIFSGTVDFDPSAGVTNLTSVGGSFDGYIAKYNATGAFVWAKSFGGSGTDQPNGLDVDRNGNITLVGQFTSIPMDADPGPGVFNLTAADRDAFILHLDNNGNFLWAKSIGSSGNDNGCKVASDAAGNLIAAYWFQGSVNVDGPVTAKGATDGLVVKYDPNGNVIWKFNVGAPGPPGASDNSVLGVLVDKNNYIIVSGYLNGSIDYNPLGSPAVVTGDKSMFLAKYSPAGILQWFKTINGDMYNYGVHLTADSQDNIYIGGTFTGSLTFAPAPSLSSRGDQGVFFAKYSSAGNLIYYKNIGNARAFINNYGLATGPDNSLYISGYFEGNVDFDPSPQVANINYHGNRDMFLVKYDDAGNYQWAFGLGNADCNNNLARYINVTANNEILLTGSFCSMVNFDGTGCNISNMTAKSTQRDMFIARYTANAAGVSNNTIAAPANITFCNTADADLIVGSTPVVSSGTFSYQWQTSTDGVTFADILNETDKDYDPLPKTATTHYRRQVISGVCAVPSVSSTVTIYVEQFTPITNNIITEPTVPRICKDGDPDLVRGASPAGGSGNYSYQWQKSEDNITFTNIANTDTKDHNPTPIAVTTYYRRIVSSGLSNCAVPSTSEAIAVYVLDPSTATNIIGQATPDAPFCTPTANPSIISGSESGGNPLDYIYQWESCTDNLNFKAIEDVNANNRDYDPPVISQTTYYRRLITSACQRESNKSNVITITLLNPASTNTITAPTVSGFCNAGDAGLITGSNPQPNGNVNYQWQQSADNINFTNINGATAKDYDPPSASATTYYRRMVTYAPCNIATPGNTVTIVINPLPTATVSAEQTICLGETVTLNATGGSRYSWSPGTGLSSASSASPVASPHVTTVYTVSIYNDNCATTLNVKVKVVTKPTVNAGADKNVISGDRVNLNAQVGPTDTVTYNWTPATYLDNPNVANPVATPLNSITYRVTATSIAGCFIVSDDVTISVQGRVVVPNTFTPNGDGINDLLVIEGLDTYKQSILTVFNRTGQQVFKSVAYPKPWDGTHNGKPLPLGTYYYVIQLNDGQKPRSGWITILK